MKQILEVKNKDTQRYIIIFTLIRIFGGQHKLYWTFCMVKYKSNDHQSYVAKSAFYIKIICILDCKVMQDCPPFYIHIECKSQMKERIYQLLKICIVISIKKSLQYKTKATNWSLQSLFLKGKEIYSFPINVLKTDRFDINVDKFQL